MLKFVSVLVVAVILASGCSVRTEDAELIVKEKCYDGVVYIDDSWTDSISVKFLRDGEVATTTIDGKSCQ